MALDRGVEGGAQASMLANRQGTLEALSSLLTTHEW
jgi:hypothetical protein